MSLNLARALRILVMRCDEGIFRVCPTDENAPTLLAVERIYCDSSSPPNLDSPLAVMMGDISSGPEPVLSWGDSTSSSPRRTATFSGLSTYAHSSVKIATAYSYSPLRSACCCCAKTSARFGEAPRLLMRGLRAGEGIFHSRGVLEGGVGRAYVLR